MSDRQLIADLLSALEYHTEQTRPIEFSRVAIEAAREYLRKPAQQQEPEYKGWYCAHCQRGVDGSEVTYHEQHTVCGRVITDDVPPKAQQQEPVATVADLTPQKRHDFINAGWDSTDPLYTSPPASKPLSGYINRAGINANDSPITVVEKLERAIEASNQETQRIWQGLTDEEVLDMARTFGAQPWPPGSCVALGQMVEAKLKEKNA